MTTASAVRAPACATHDLYYAVHKGLRFAHGAMLSRIGLTDCSDEKARQALVAALRAHLAMCRTHLIDEDREIHVAVEARSPGASQGAEQDHDQHALSLVELGGQIDELESAVTTGNEAARRLYRRFALFVADDLRHMEEEETVMLDALQSHFSDAELRDIEGRIVQSIPPDVMIGFMRAILPALRRDERIGMIGGMRAGMPADAFAGLMTAIFAEEWKISEKEALYADCL